MKTLITALLIIFSLTTYGQTELVVIGKVVGSSTINTQVESIIWDDALGTANILWKSGAVESVSYYPSSISITNDVSGVTVFMFEAYTNGYALFGFVIDNNTQQSCAFYIRNNGDKQIYLLQ